VSSENRLSNSKLHY